jgi:hypothetical protein
LKGNESLLSFAAVTDDPPAGIAAHDHCIIPIARKRRVRAKSSW